MAANAKTIPRSIARPNVNFQAATAAASNAASTVKTGLSNIRFHLGNGLFGSARSGATVGPKFSTGKAPGDLQGDVGKGRRQ